MVNLITAALAAWATVTQPTYACNDFGSFVVYEFFAYHEAPQEVTMMLQMGECVILGAGTRIEVEPSEYAHVVKIVHTNEDGSIRQVGWIHDENLEYDRQG